ncbi:hypothetical protein COY16_00245 [Candidatus Roizmanbacteria bacterium CG_4_10_14_0_2_um_filter_39_13]|uniref:Uncharacterized protein n=1 Tax=Candidatus Roizmanbacteria bacterium CG_4_10_14_0_2_um_filter_39_13 TaxID=1974825 RepID=A0A2M7U1U6_9BACT|nr:MAG: hypothetical protein COY16_00245 [Candidatus Roizmanbacteria bacterium CG_4_10_14_0_2_um_filter_39_13]
MIIPCVDIVSYLDEQLKLQVAQLKEKNISPKLVTILLGQAPEQLSFVSIKQRKAEMLGIDFEFLNLSNTPPFKEFLGQLLQIAQNPSTTGIIIQHPLPEHYDLEKMYTLIPSSKEIEGHLTNSYFQFPLSLSVLSGLKFIFSNEQTPENAVVDFQNDIPFFKNVLQNKNIVIAGKGPTGGKPIGKSFAEIGVPFTVVDSKTTNPDDIFRSADIIITATGRKVISSDNIKPGAILLNVGLRKEEGRLMGDLDEKSIDQKAAWYNITPRGFGPLDVSYLYKNLLQSARLNLSP